MENEIIVDEVQNVLTEEVFVEEQKTPKLNYEYCRANGITKSDIKRFWKKIKLPDDLIDGCWIWQAAKNKNGYGLFSFAGSTYRAHRFSHMIFKGEIGEDLCVRHTCNNPGCVNPFHLLSGTHQDNSNDMTEQNRQCNGRDHHLAKLTELEVKEILDKLILGYTGPELSEEYNVSELSIYKISHGETWKDIYALLTEDKKSNIIELKTEK